MAPQVTAWVTEHQGYHLQSPLILKSILLRNASARSESREFNWLTYYRLPTKLRKGNVFTSVCQEFCSRGEVYIPPGRHPLGRNYPSGQTLPLGRHPPAADTPWTDTPWTHPPGRHNPPPADGYCSGRYASWNAFLFFTPNFAKNQNCKNFYTEHTSSDKRYSFSAKYRSIIKFKSENKIARMFQDAQKAQSNLSLYASVSA